MRRSLSVFLILILLCSSLVVPERAVQAQTAFDADNIQRSTVLLYQVVNNVNGTRIITCEGSGTLVSTDGLILTNAHNVLPGRNCRADRIVVALTLRVGEAPVATYYAEVVTSSRGADLSVLQITSTLDNRPVDRATLVLPFVELGESDAIRLDDTLAYVGYPTPGESLRGLEGQVPVEGSNAPVSTTGAALLVRGTISGFTAESRVGDRAWIKTRTPIPGGFSGGGAFDTNGRLVGIPTVQPSVVDGSAASCRRVQDSNADGRVDTADTCIPINGVINALRPIRLARGLILAAKLGISARTSQDEGIETTFSQNVAPRFSRLLFAAGVSPTGMPTNIVSSLPTGASSLYLFFDYDNMREGMVYELRVTLDGVPNPVFSLAPATWTGSTRGMWYVGSTSQVWPNGEYEFNLFIEGTRAAAAQIAVGETPALAPSFSDILFGVFNEQTSQLENNGALLPVADQINAEFVYNNIPDGTPWRQVWSYEGLTISDTNATEGGLTWSDGANGKKQIVALGNALQPGRYRLDLYIADRLAATSDFILAGGAVSRTAETFTNVQFTNDVQLSRNNTERVIGTAFTGRLTSLYATYDWRQIGSGTPWTWRLSIDDNVLYESTTPWRAGSDGTEGWIGFTTRDALPDGTYKIEILLVGVVRASTSARVGLGQLPITTFGGAEGLALQGVIVDAETGRGIAGVSVIVLEPLLDVADFTYSMDQIYAMSLTDSQGQFSISRPLSRGLEGEYYSIIIVARGYLPLSADGVEVGLDTPSPLVLRLELNRD